MKIKMKHMRMIDMREKIILKRSLQIINMENFWSNNYDKYLIFVY